MGASSGDDADVVLAIQIDYGGAHRLQTRCSGAVLHEMEMPSDHGIDRSAALEVMMSSGSRSDVPVAPNDHDAVILEDVLPR